MGEYRKHVVAKLNMPYAVGACVVDGETCLVAATEDHGPALMSRPPFTSAVEMVPGPGGCMALVQRSPGELFAIMGCFLGYKFQTGAVYRITKAGAGWTVARIVDLPFAHRIDFVMRGRKQFLVAASIAADKKDAADWSRTGSVYVSEVPGSPGGTWSLRPVLEGIHRNHGLLVAPFRGRPSVLVAGAEGIFAASLDATGTDWGFERVMERETSELALLDLDGDGIDELITIEPFHGSSLRVYRPGRGPGSPAWEGKLEYGHCLAARSINGVASLLVSNRAGSRDLLLLQWGSGARGGTLGEPEVTVLDAGAGAANMTVLRQNGRDLIFATNQTAGEVACFEEER
jgi:hypothetical protein